MDRAPQQTSSGQPPYVGSNECERKCNNRADQDFCSGRVAVTSQLPRWIRQAVPSYQLSRPPRTSRSADLAIAQSIGDRVPFALAAAAGCSGSEPVMSLSALPFFSNLESKPAPALALGGLLSPSFSPSSEGKDMLHPAIATARAPASKFRDAP